MTDAHPSPLQVRRALIGARWPATRDELIDHLLSHGAQSQILADLRSLPEQRFTTNDDLTAALQNRQTST